MTVCHLQEGFLLDLQILGLVWLVAWELGKMREVQAYLPLHPSTSKRLDLADLVRATPLPQELVVKETPATNRLHIPPPVLSGYAPDHTGISLSGMGGGGGCLINWCQSNIAAEPGRTGYSRANEIIHSCIQRLPIKSLGSLSFI
jgi:hypothetical protein